MVTEEFVDWLTKRLIIHEIDPEVYRTYICGILEEENVERNEVEESLSDILSSFVDDPESLSKEVFSHWITMCCNSQESNKKDDEETSLTIDKIVAAHNSKKISEKMTSQIEQTDEDKAEKLALKKALLEKYSEVDVCEREEENEPISKGTTGKGMKSSSAPTVDTALSMFQNLNTSLVSEAEKKQREKQKEEATKKKEKDKLDRERLKSKKDERKEKEKKRTQKKEKGR